MSYDFQLFRVPCGVDPMSAYQTHLAQEKARASRKLGDDYCDVIDPLKEQLKRRVSAALVASYPELQLCERDYAKLAKRKCISEDEARRRYTDLELTDLESGLQITLFDDAAYVTLSFGLANRTEAEGRFQMAWGCLQVLEQEGGFSIYDSQAGTILHLNSDFEFIRRAYLTASRVVGDALGREPV